MPGIVINEDLDSRAVSPFTVTEKAKQKDECQFIIHANNFLNTYEYFFFQVCCCLL